MSESVEAGKGEHHVYPIRIDADTQPIVPGTHYLGIDAASWFVNKSSSFFSDFTVSGTIEIALASGAEKYQAALGTFELDNGAKTAPIFDRPMLPDRNLRGGPITVGVSLVSFRRDTIACTMLRAASNASLGIIGGLVEGATKAGTHQQLAKAGETLVGSVRDILGRVEKHENLFSGGGIEVNLRPAAVCGRVSYLLFHRGSTLEPSDLSIRMSDTTSYPTYRGADLADGAWLLVRLRRNDRYPGAREWFDGERKLRMGVENLVRDVEDRITTVERALVQLAPSNDGTTTLFDQFLKLREVIQSDGVLSEAEARARVDDLWTVYRTARNAIQSRGSGQAALGIAAIHGPTAAQSWFRGGAPIDVIVRGEGS